MPLPPIAFIGGGNMASAIIAALADASEPPPIAVCDPSESVRERHAAAGHTVTERYDEAVATADIIVLAVKPQVAAVALDALAPLVLPRHLIVSIMAGITIDAMRARLPAAVSIVRTMPNTPLAIALGMVGIAAGDDVAAEQLDQVRQLFAGCAEVLVVGEDRLNAVTAISGSGPAYVFRFAEALLAAADELGFTADEARLLVCQTLRGAATYLSARDDVTAAELREQVTSPGGTTAAALAVFDERDLMGMVAEAVRAAERRGSELARDHD